MAEPPFSGMSTPFAAHHSSFGPASDIGSGTASYFGNFGDEQESSTSNPFAFINSVGVPGQGAQQNVINPLSGAPLKPPPAPVVDSSDGSRNFPGVVAACQSTYEAQHTPSAPLPSQPHLSHQHSMGSLNVSMSTIFDNQPGELSEDPFASYIIPEPRSKSSQAQSRDTAQMSKHDTFSGSVSAPVTGVISTYQDNNLLESTPALISLPSSSSGSLIERPPLSPLLPPSSNMTNAAISSGAFGCLPVVHSYPHLPTNATNATEDNTTQVSSGPYLTNAVGYPVQSSQASVEPSREFPPLNKSDIVHLQSEGGSHSQQKAENTVHMTGTEKDYLTLNRERLQCLLEGDHSLSSSLNQSMSSLLESQEDITQTSPVQILPPAPVAQQPLPTSKGPLNSLHIPPTSSTREQVSLVQEHVMPTETEVETPRQTTQEQTESSSDHQPAQSFLLPQHRQLHYTSGPGAIPTSDPLNVPMYKPPQMVSSPNPTLSSSHPAHAVAISSSLPPPVSSGGMQEGAVGLTHTGGQLNHLPGVVDPDKGATQQRNIQTSSVDHVQTQAVPSQEKTNACLPITSEGVISSQTSPHVYSSGMTSDSPPSAHPVQHHHDSQPTITAKFVHQPLHQDNVQDHTYPPVTKPLEGPSAQVSTEGTDSLSTARQLSSYSILNPPMLPPPTAQPELPAVLSNAHIVSPQPTVPSNAHRLNQPPISNTRPPPSETMVIQGVLSNAHLPQYTMQSSAGVQPPPVTTSANTALLPPQPQNVAPAVPTVSTAMETFTKPPPQSVPLNQAPINNNLPSTPDSVFVTSPPPLVTSSVATVVGAPYQSGMVSTGSHTAPSVQPTETQAGKPTQLQPGVVSAPHSLVQPDTQAPSSLSHHHVPTGMPVQLPTPHPLFHSNTNAVTSNLQPSAISSSEPAAHTHPPVSAEPVKSDRHNVLPVQQLPTNPVATSASVPSTHPPSSGTTGPTQPLVTEAATAQASSTVPPHREHQVPRNSTQQDPSLPPSSVPHHSHHQHPPPATRHPYGNRVGPENDRHWRHTAEIQHPRERERYDPYHDTYRYERSRHYPYEDPYYDYYRERPDSQAPHLDRYSYYPEHYEHDPYEYDRLYHRPVKEYDPYTGHYYYVDERFSYPDPHAYDPYSHEFYEHPSRGVHHAHPQLYKEQSDPQRYAEEHVHAHHPSSLQQEAVDGPHEPVTTYPDQSTIYGAHDVFEEGGTFVDSPNVQGTHRHQHQHPPYTEGHVHSEYHGYPNYVREPHVQPLWDSNEGVAPANETQEPPLVFRRTPELFAHPHVRASFAPGGTLVVVLPHNLRAFQRAEVELSHVTELVDNGVHANFFKAVSEFPGPLMPGETPKSVAVSYASRQAEQCRARKLAEEREEEDAETSKELHDEALLWDFLVLLCQHNGVVVASDISELLTREKMAVIPTHNHVGNGDHEGDLENIRQLLMAGRKRDALELACSQCLWGHALMLASKMDEQNRTYVINRFTASLVSTDPLSTFYTLMLGRTPSAVKPDGLRRAGSWQHHLAMILANRSSKLDNSSMVTLGDSLLESGRLCAAHFCYHLADVQFGAYGSITSKYLLLGVQNNHLTVGTFPRPEYLRKMEVFEYAMGLGKLEFVLPHVQVFKYLLALQLAQVGMVAKAFKYCEQIAMFISRSPGKFPPTLLHVVDQLSTQLHHLNHPHGVVETELPSWLLMLQQTTSDVLAGNYALSAHSTPSPAFSSVSQAYASQQNAFGQGRHQYLKVPGNSYKGGSVEPSTEASSKEGSVIGTAATNTGQNSYPPSTLVQQQEPSGYAAPLPPQEQLQTGQFPSGPESEQAGHVITSSAPGNGSLPYNPPDQSQVPYPPTTTEVSSTSGGDINMQPFHPPQQYANADSGGYDGFGMASIAAPDDQQQQPPPGQEQQPYVHDPAVDGRQPQPSLYPSGYRYHQQGGVQEQAQQYGYTPQSDSTQDVHTNHQFTEPTHPPGEDVYGVQNHWGMQQWSSEKRHTSQSDGNNREEEEASKQGNEREEKDVKKKDEIRNRDSTPQEGPSKSGFLSYFMPWRKSSGPPRAKLPSDKDPRIVWDEKQRKWVDLDADDEGEEAPTAPPTDAELTSAPRPGVEGGSDRAGQPPEPTALPPPTQTNAYSLQAKSRHAGVRSKYVDVLNPSSSGVGGASSQAPPPGPPPPAMVSGIAPPSFFIPQQLPPSGEFGDVSRVTTASTTAPPSAEQPSNNDTQTQPSSDLTSAAAQGSRDQPHAPLTTGGAQFPSQPVPPPPSHDLHHGPPTNIPQSAPHSMPNMTEPPQPSPATMPQFFNPSAFAPMSSMTGPLSDSQDDAQSTISELSQEVSRINSLQLSSTRPTSYRGGHSRLHRGRRVAYPSSMPPSAGGPPPRHK